MSHSEENPESTQTAVNAANEALDNLRISLESDRPSPTSKRSVNGVRENGAGLTKVEQLENELRRALEEKDTLADQYRNLVSRLNTMKSTLGNKLRQDAASEDCLSKSYAVLIFASLGRIRSKRASYSTVNRSK